MIHVNIFIVTVRTRTPEDIKDYLHTCISFLDQIDTSESHSCPHLANLLFNFPDLFFHLTSNPFLLVSAEEEESLAQIAIDAALDRNVVTSVHQMIATTDWRFFGTEMLFQTGKEIDIFSVQEGHEDTECALEPSPEDDFLAARNEGCLL